MEEHEEDLEFEKRKGKRRTDDEADEDTEDDDEYVPLDVAGLKPEKRTRGMT